MARRTAALAAVLLLAGCARVVNGRGSVEPGFPTRLSHTAVERYIEGGDQLGNPTGVVCNDGRDFPLRAAGDSFECVSGERSFRVTITDPENGSYTVS
jgi:hypothetical protein